MNIKPLVFIALAAPTLAYAWLKRRSQVKSLRAQPFYDQARAKGVPLEIADLVAEILRLIKKLEDSDYRLSETKPLTALVKKSDQSETPISIRTRQGRDTLTQACERKAASKLLKLLEGETDWLSREGFIQEVQPEVTILELLKDIREIEAGKSQKFPS